MLNVVSKRIQASSRDVAIEETHMKKSMRLSWWISLLAQNLTGYTTRQYNQPQRCPT